MNEYWTWRFIAIFTKAWHWSLILSQINPVHPVSLRHAIYLPAYLLFYPSVCLFVYLSIYLSIYLRVSINLCICSPFVGPWPLFQLLNPIHSRYDSLNGVARPLPTHRTTQTRNKRTQTSMGFELTIPALEGAKTVHALDLAATVFGKIRHYFVVFSFHLFIAFPKVLFPQVFLPKRYAFSFSSMRSTFPVRYILPNFKIIITFGKEARWTSVA
jgi:hypothetical protein